jgi:hypothetical protein
LEPIQDLARKKRVEEIRLGEAWSMAQTCPIEKHVR